MPTLFGQEVSPDVYAANQHLLNPPKEPKTAARKDLDAELKAQFARRFEANWALCGGPVLKKEVEFCPGREWRADYVYIADDGRKYILELDGGVWTRGRHTRGGGFINDCFKLNAAVMLGYQPIRIATGMENIDYLRQIIAAITAP